MNNPCVMFREIDYLHLTEIDGEVLKRSSRILAEQEEQIRDLNSGVPGT
jgi:hypothetical protein